MMYLGSTNLLGTNMTSIVTAELKVTGARSMASVCAMDSQVKQSAEGNS